MRDAYAAALSSQRQPCRRWARSGAWLVVSPVARSTELSVTRGVTDPTLQPLQDQDRCVLGMRPVRGISDRASLKLQSKDRSLCVRRRVVSQAGKLTRAYLRNAGTYWSYERALLYRIPEGVPHVIASRRSSACHSRCTARISVACSFHSADDRRLEQLSTITQPNHIRVAAETATTQSNRWSQY